MSRKRASTFQFAPNVRRPKDMTQKLSCRQKANVAFCPCCVQATYIAAPSSFKLGAYSSLEELGVRLWASAAPWAGRRMAATSYVQGNNGAPLAPGRDWVARSLEFVPLPPLFRSASRGFMFLFPRLRRVGIRRNPAIRIGTRILFCGLRAKP